MSFRNQARGIVGYLYLEVADLLPLVDLEWGRCGVSLLQLVGF
jgi:hypothetical protein